MYSISVPVIWKEEEGMFLREEILNELKRAKADRIMLAVERKFSGGRLEYVKNVEKLRSDVEFFKQNGLEVVIWIGESIGHGGYEWRSIDDHEYKKFASINGVETAGCFCPSDELFIEDLSKQCALCASTNPDGLLLDDDFRLWNHGDPGMAGCYCDVHIHEFEKRVGKKLTREEAARLVWSGKANPYRDEWLNIQSETMYKLAEAIRKEVDKQNPNVRIGLCTSSSMADGDGVDLERMYKLLAGKNKPLVRLFGAPYWAGLQNPIGRSIELERMLRYFFKNADMEFIAEGDAYPRPRYFTSAASMENFDMAIRASGGFDGNLKYMLDYTSSPTYETGYIDSHVGNEEIYAKIEKAFNNKIAVGIRIFENLSKMKYAEYGENPIKEVRKQERMVLFPPAIMFATEHSIPICYEGEQAALIFGENGRHATSEEYKNGAILDLCAARIMTERGIDVGLMSWKKAERIVKAEFFISENEYVALNKNEFACDIEISENAKPLTKLVTDRGKLNGCYLYENADGYRFMVMPYDLNEGQLTPSYSRQRLISESVVWLNGQKIEAFCMGNPYLYMICKKDDNSMSVAVWNFLADKVKNAVVELNDSYSKVEWIAGEGKLDGDKLTVSEINPFGYAIFVLKK